MGCSSFRRGVLASSSCKALGASEHGRGGMASQDLGIHFDSGLLAVPPAPTFPCQPPWQPERGLQLPEQGRGNLPVSRLSDSCSNVNHGLHSIHA
jgi:hypothetical protein